MLERIKAKWVELKERATALAYYARDWLTAVRWDRYTKTVFGYCRWFNGELCHAFGVTTTVHWSVFVCAALMALVNPFEAGVFLMALLLCIVPHEYGHALAGQRYGIKTRKIGIYPIGGVAILEKSPATPWQEIVVTAAGPLTTLALAVLGLVMMALVHTPYHYMVDGHEFVAAGFWGYFTGINVVLFVFNMLPAFPMDGGRLLRAGLELAFKDRLRATYWAYNVSVAIAGLLLLVGVWTLSPGLCVVMLFILLAGRQELAAAAEPPHPEPAPEKKSDKK